MRQQFSCTFVRLAALSTLVSLGLSSLLSQPGLALSPADQAWAEGFGIPLHTIDDDDPEDTTGDTPSADAANMDTLAASESPVMSREELILSTQAMLDSMLLLIGSFDEEFYEYERIHENAERYLSDRVVRLTNEANELLGQPQSNTGLESQRLANSTSIDSHRIATHHLASHRIATLFTKQADLPPAQPSDIDPNAFYASDFPFLSANLNLTFDDGTFRPNDYLTQSQYLDYLQQIDRLMAEWYDQESLLTMGDPVEWVANTPAAEEGNAALSGLLDQVEDVRELIDELRELQNKEYATNKTTDSTTVKATQAYSSRTVSTQVQPDHLAQLEQPAILSISEIPDVSPGDSIYEPLRRLVEEYGIDPVLTAGQFSAQTPVTRGEAATYLAAMLAFPVGGEQGWTLSLAIGEYAILSEELQVLEERLNGAIAQYQ